MSDRTPHPDYPDRDTKGRLLPGHRSRITTQNARDMQAKSSEAQRKNTVERARELVKSEIAAVYPGIETFEDAWGAIVGSIGADAIDKEYKLRDRVQAMKAVGHASDAMPDKHGVTNKLKVEVSMSDQLARALQVEAETRVIDAEWVDGFDNSNCRNHDGGGTRTEENEITKHEITHNTQANTPHHVP